MISCIVFDLDDTLYLERDYVRSGFDAVGELVTREFGVTGFSEYCWSRFLSGARGDIFNGACADCAIADSPGMIARLVSRYREHEPAIELLPDSAEVLPQVAKIARAAVITDGPRASQSRKVSALKLQQWASPIVLTDDLGPEAMKPSPKAFELVQQHHGLDGPACAYVGDNPRKDFVSPRVLGWRTIRIRRPLGLHVDVPSGDDVDQEIEDLTQLLSALTVQRHA